LPFLGARTSRVREIRWRASFREVFASSFFLREPEASSHRPVSKKTCRFAASLKPQCPRRLRRLGWWWKSALTQAVLAFAQGPLYSGCGRICRGGKSPCRVQGLYRSSECGARYYAARRGSRSPGNSDVRYGFQTPLRRFEEGSLRRAGRERGAQPGRRNSFMAAIHSAGVWSASLKVAGTRGLSCSAPAETCTANRQSRMFSGVRRHDG